MFEVRHLGMAAPVAKPGGGELNVVAPAMRLSRTPAQLKHALGAAGEHNAAVLRDLGYSESEIASLREDKVI